jgi:hypothetical protein
MATSSKLKDGDGNSVALAEPTTRTGRPTIFSASASKVVL